MALSDDLRALRDQALADLSAAHDYYADTKTAWRVVQRVVARGHQFSSQNVVTGTKTTEVELEGKARGYVAQQLSEATFQQFLSIFESFYFDLLRFWLTEYPGSLGKKTVEFGAILELPDMAAITAMVVRNELNQVLYTRPTGWFDYLDSKVKLGCPTAEEVERIAEAKASRDVLVHNRGIANTVYVAKAEGRARFREGERLTIPSRYHREVWELIRKVIADVSNAAIEKAA